jgi:arylsulfatase A-like enzyme
MGKAAAARTLSLLVAASGAGCVRAPEPPPLERLLPALGPLTFLTLDEVARPVTLLRPGESRTCSVVAGPRTRLRFWVGLPKPPTRGFVEVRAEAGGRTVVERRTAAGRLQSWMELSGEVPAHARELKLTAALVTAHGRPLPSGPEEVLLAVGSPRLVHRREEQPRVVLWISQDTVRADRLGAYGYARPTSPVFDRLARGSLVFENAMSTSSWTLPALASQATSLLPSEHGALRSDLARRPEAGPTVFEVLSRHGFTVLGATANVFFSPAHGLADGFDTLLVHPLARADVLIDRLLQRLAEWDGGDLALFVHLMDPHLPYVPPPPYDTLLGPEAPSPQTASPAERKRTAWSAAYDGEIAWTDAQIGRLLRALEERGLFERALVLYTADHGDELLDHGGFDHGHTLYEELVRVPLVLRVPGGRGGRIATPVSTLDIAPTLLDALGLEAPASFRGESLLPLADGKPRRGRYLFAETETKQRRPRQYAVREGQLKLILGLSREEEGRVVARQLFDLHADPFERASLPASEIPLDRVAEGYVATARAKAAEGRRAVLGAEAIEQLKALGYLQ